MVPRELKLASDKRGENSDCAVKAVAIITGADYDEVHAVFAKCGRKPCKGTKRYITRDVLFQLGYKTENITPTIRSKTVRTLVRDDPEIKSTETYLVFVKGHVLVIKNGKAHDWTAGRLHRIRIVERVIYDLG